MLPLSSRLSPSFKSPLATPSPLWATSSTNTGSGVPPQVNPCSFSATAMAHAGRALAFQAGHKNLIPQRAFHPIASARGLGYIIR
jgi:hypothetical protein